MIYDAVKAVLSDLDAQGCADHDDWEDLVAARLASLESSYPHLTKPNHELIDYSDLATQASYVFRYVLGHAEFNYDFLKHARESIGSPLFEDEILTITSIGGGPGSELLGLLKYLSEDQEEPVVSKIIYTVVDKEQNWQHVLEALVEAIDTDITVEIIYQIFDITAKAIPASVNLEEEDAVFMSFFISEVCVLPQNNRVCANLQSMLRSLPAGKLLIYKDSSAYSFYRFFNEQVAAAGQYNQLLDLKNEYKVDAPDYDGIFEEYVNQYDYRPKLSSSAVSKVLKRV